MIIPVPHTIGSKPSVDEKCTPHPNYRIEFGSRNEPILYYIRTTDSGTSLEIAIGEVSRTIRSIELISIDQSDLVRMTCPRFKPPSEDVSDGIPLVDVSEWVTMGDRHVSTLKRYWEVTGNIHIETWETELIITVVEDTDLRWMRNIRTLFGLTPTGYIAKLHLPLKSQIPISDTPTSLG